MGKTKQKAYGKSIAKIQGYNIRIMFKDGNNPSGKFGIFAGKKMLQEASSIPAAKNQIVEIVGKSIK